MSAKTTQKGGLTIRQVAPAALTPAPYNPRSMTADARARLERGVREFGFVDPIIARREDGLVIGGHQRLAAAQAIGLATVPVVYLDGISDGRAKALNVLLNNPAAQGEWEMARLADIMRELEEGDFDATLTGFDGDALSGLLSWQPEHEMREESPDVDLSLPEEPESKRGEIYALGSHRLLCGDATKAADVSRLMGQDRAEVLWTDPPYGVSYVGKTNRKLTIQNDGAGGLLDLLTSAFRCAAAVMMPGARFYCAAPAGPHHVTFLQAIAASGLRFAEELVWVKNAMVLGHADYHYRHEPILYGHKPGDGRVGRGAHAGTRWYGDHAQTSVFEFDKPARSEEHPTMKPPELIRAHLTNSARRGDVVLDLFAGSGSTLVASEQRGCAARLMEIDPAYCDVIRRRYAALVA